MSDTIQRAARLNNTGEYYFSAKLARIREMITEGRQVINLGIGSPDLPPHPEVIQKLNETALQPGAHGYQPYLGIPALREAVDGWYRKYFSVSLDPGKNILPVMGSKEAILQLSLAYLNPGDTVLVPDPGYPAYPVLAGMAGAVARKYHLREAAAWLPDLDELEMEGLDGVKMMWVNYPHMPTGRPADAGFFSRLTAFGQKHGILICNDNPYGFILSESPLSLLPPAGPVPGMVELNSLSKSHNMAGWRIGFILAHEQHIRDTLLVSSNYQSGMFLPLQRAAVFALGLDSDWYEGLNRVYRSRRILAERLMQALGCSFDPGQQGLFLWGKMPGTGPGDMEYTEQLLEQAEIFITPGSVFGPGGEGYLRISLCATEEIIEKAIERVVNL